MRIERYGHRQEGPLAAFYDAVQRDIKLFAFILLTLCVYRAYFMFYMAGYLSPSAGADDVLLALLTGFLCSHCRALLLCSDACAFVGAVLRHLHSLCFSRRVFLFIGSFRHRSTCRSRRG